MRVFMQPHLSRFRAEESGIKRVVEGYFKYLPQFGIELVEEDEAADLIAVHAGRVPRCDVAHNHGLYWTGDYHASAWEWAVNGQVIECLRSAKEITVPSEWVAETIRRDMRRIPHVIGHGIDWDDWQHEEPNGAYILWNKNRKSDVCDPTVVNQLAKLHPQEPFVTTFAAKAAPPNVKELGLVPFGEMKQAVQSAGIYLATVKETFGIGILEAMASGVPVLGAAWGGVLDLVEHGVNGYLARPGDLGDLSEGLSYCMAHRAVLGANGREMARAYTWDKVAEQVAHVYELAAAPKLPTAAIVIPTYNYAEQVGRAIESATQQTYNYLTDIVVVDDGSADGGETEREVHAWMEHDRRVRYVRQGNAGVAAARNTGIDGVDVRYVCCLDADDAIEPLFLEVCAEALEKDQKLGIAYTGLHYIKPDGTEGTSPWPGEWDYDRQLKRQNQVPTCCVFRREMWAALYGYRSRYCPQGAGTEDADLWTRSGAYGWAAEKVTKEPLFLYSWQSGRVSGDPNYSEVDWLAWHPWAADQIHPFASYAKPKRWSHPVRQYDEPTVSVVIPVGPGHGAAQLVNALDSLDSQTFRKWEGIVVWDQEGEPPAGLVRGFPHIHWIPLGQNRGAGVARNVGAEAARSPFLVFLDADDWLAPECLDKMVAEWERREACIYTDYVGKAFVSDPLKLAPDLRQRILWRDEADGQTIMEYHAADYDWERAQRQPEGERPWTWNIITTLVPKAWHDEIGGFDEAMVSWEDVDYWYRLALAGKPFVRIAEPLVVYVIWAGTRREAGRAIHADLLNYMRTKYRGIEKKMCSGCGRSRPRHAPPAMAAQRSQAVIAALSDNDFVMCRFIHPARGQRMIYGQATFERRIEGLHMVKARNAPGYIIHYGYRDNGDEFLVHKNDVALSPHLYQPIEARGPVRSRREAPPPPESQGQSLAPVVKGDNGESRPTLAQSAEIDLQTLPGITSEISAQLQADGITTRDAILGLGIEGLQGYKGVGPKKAETILGAIASLGGA